jgi:glycine/D-amino acid oxidase-like deaminating enzyme
MNRHDSDVVLVGAGIVGAFAALRLVQRNCTVFLIVREISGVSRQDGVPAGYGSNIVIPSNCPWR